MINLQWSNNLKRLIWTNFSFPSKKRSEEEDSYDIESEEEDKVSELQKSVASSFAVLGRRSSIIQVMSNIRGNNNNNHDEVVGGKQVDFDIENVMKMFPTKVQVSLGITAFQAFLHCYMNLPIAKTKIRLAMDSILDKYIDWINFINTSLKTKNYDEDKFVCFANVPSDIEKKLNPMQFLLVMKHFRPDEMERFSKFFIRKSFSNIIENVPKTNFGEHSASDWF